ncbi:hypothetical protein F5144DRAFT_605003 [Chaetomium tenue]|uniref:Uncharacterized protein n=1 Tax=Chaetomium tenue TaxID=1854479 RepID=A0ACB7P8I3_9PEZI|nr:hypothetical protein F5144DRAFT_605003 [Chaetomium globosum]
MREWLAWLAAGETVYAPSCDTLQPSPSSYDFDFLTHLNWDPAAASTFDLVDSASIPAATASGAELHSNFSSPELDFNLDLDLAPCLDAFSTPLFNENSNLNNNNFFPLVPASLPIPPLSSANTSLTNTPATTDLQSPSPAPPSPDSGSLLHPGLKLPQTKAHPSKPGRRPAGARLSHTTDGRVTKRSNHHGAATASASASSAAAAAALQQQQEATGYDIDPEVIDRRHRNNLAAKRYRQKKIDRIEELEGEVKEVTRERDDLRIRLARQEAEIAALREMLKMQQNGSGGSKD